MSFITYHKDRPKLSLHYRRADPAPATVDRAVQASQLSARELRRIVCEMLG